MDERFTTGLGRIVVRLLARWSGTPDVVVVNSEKGQALHAGTGYRPDRWEVIANGFDLDRFRPDPDSRSSVRHELGFPDESILIGLLARRDPVKGHSTFLHAAAALSRKLPQSRFLLAGSGVGNDGALAAEAAALGLADRVAMLGPRNDMPRLTAALDLATCASSWEGFPNVVGEALACGIPVVTTDVGDAAIIVGDCGIVVPPGDPEGMAEAWASLLTLSTHQRAALGRAAREQMAVRYDISTAAGRYATLYLELASHQKP
jgi:glycosyltransferase involved in cell wall biosynthesis